MQRLYMERAALLNLELTLCRGRCAAHDMLRTGFVNTVEDERWAFDFALTNVFASISGQNAALRSG
jgi:hypothetical protein